MTLVDLRLAVRVLGATPDGMRALARDLGLEETVAGDERATALVRLSPLTMGLLRAAEPTAAAHPHGKREGAERRAAEERLRAAERDRDRAAVLAAMVVDYEGTGLDADDDLFLARLLGCKHVSDGVTISKETGYATEPCYSCLRDGGEAGMRLTESRQP